MTGSLQIKNDKYYMVLNSTKNGKRKQQWISTGLTVKGNKRRAEQMLREKIAEAEKVTGDAAHIPFADYVEHWLQLARERVDEVTFQNYQALARRHILPWFRPNAPMLSDIDRKTIQEFLDEKHRNGRLDGKGGLSEKSVRELKNILNLVFKEAQREELINESPCKLLKLPPKEPSKAEFYTAAQLNALLEAVRDEQLYPIIKTAVVYGLRRSEILGLKWDSIDFESNTLTVKHTVVTVYEKVEKDKTKTKSSRRSFPLTPEMRETFLDLHAEQETNRRLFGKEYVDSEYVFCWSDGRPISSDYVSHGFGKLLKKYGFPHIRFHDLRHSCASLLLNNGFTLKDVQEWMGHSDIQTTANVYGHLDTARKQALADSLTQNLLPSSLEKC